MVIECAGLFVVGVVVGIICGFIFATHIYIQSLESFEKDREKKKKKR